MKAEAPLKLWLLPLLTLGNLLALNQSTFRLGQQTLAMNQFEIELEGAGISHIYCTDHILQLTAKLVHSDKNLNEERWQAVKKARGIVSFINKSTQANEKLKQKQTVLENYIGASRTVVTDVVTR